jgi:hypothetical protein
MSLMHQGSALITAALKFVPECQQLPNSANHSRGTFCTEHIFGGSAGSKGHSAARLKLVPDLKGFAITRVGSTADGDKYKSDRSCCVSFAAHAMAGEMRAKVLWPAYLPQAAPASSQILLFISYLGEYGLHGMPTWSSGGCCQHSNYVHPQASGNQLVTGEYAQRWQPPSLGCPARTSASCRHGCRAAS